MSGISLKIVPGKGKAAPSKRADLKQFEQDRDDGPRKELLTGVVEGQLQSKEPRPKKEGPRVIAPLKNTFQVGVGDTRPEAKKPSFVPDDDPNAAASNADKFVAAEGPQGPAAPAAYGLETRKDVGEGKQERPKSRTIQEIEAKKYKSDMDVLPDAPDQSAFDDMPVEAFGMALLRGMGYDPKKAKGPTAVEYVRRPQRLGLGAKAIGPPKDESKPPRPGQSKEDKRDLVLAPDADGRQRHVKSLDEKLVDRATLEPGPRAGKIMRAVRGHHSGLLCKVLEMEEQKEGRSARARVKLHPSEEVVSIRVSELGEKDEKPESEREPERKRSDRDQDRDRKSDRGRKSDPDRKPDRDRKSDRDRDRDRRSERKDDRKRGRDGDESGGRAKRSREEDKGDRRRDTRSPEDDDAEAPWLAPNIRVKIIDKKMKKGKLYLKKALVLDVLQPRVCNLRLEQTGEVLERVQQRDVETVVPRDEGTAVLILAGTHKGAIARLKQRKGEAAAVQLVDDLTIVPLLLDDIAEYRGYVEDE